MSSPVDENPLSYTTSTAIDEVQEAAPSTTAENAEPRLKSKIEVTLRLSWQAIQLGFIKRNFLINSSSRD